MIPKLRNIIGLISNKVDKVTGKDLSTNDFTDTYKTKLDGIATGATKNTVENSLTSTSTTNALSAAQGKVLNDKYNGTVLYDNSSGTTGTITLSETAANFSYLEIFYGIRNSSGVWSHYSSVKIFSPNGKKFMCEMVRSVSSIGIIQILAKGYSVSGTSITMNEAEMWSGFDSNGFLSAQFINGSTIIRILKVVGYR